MILKTKIPKRIQLTNRKYPNKKEILLITITISLKQSLIKLKTNLKINLKILNCQTTIYWDKIINTVIIKLEKNIEKDAQHSIINDKINYRNKL
jgi:hypothetical protein